MHCPRTPPPLPELLRVPVPGGPSGFGNIAVFYGLYPYLISMAPYLGGI